MLAAGGKTTDEYMVALIKAQRIYRATGIIIEPWNVGEFPSDWMEAIEAYTVDVPAKTTKINRTKPKR